MDEILTVEVDVVLDVLAGFAGDPAVTARLAAMAGDARLPQRLRIKALLLAGRGDDPEKAVAALEALSGAARNYELLVTARAVTELSPGGPSGRRLFERACREDGFYPGVRAAAAADMAGIGDGVLAGSTGRAVALGAQANLDDLRQAVQTWIESLPTDTERAAAAGELSRTGYTARQCACVAEALARLGRARDAEVFAMRALGAPAEARGQLHPMLAAWMRPGDERLPRVLRLLREGGDAGTWAFAARGLAEAGCSAEAAELARHALGDPLADGWAVGMATRSWLAACGPSALDEVSAALRDRDPARTRWFWSVVDALAESGSPQSAVEFAASSLPGALQDPEEAAATVGSWLAAGGPGQVGAILRALGDPGVLSAQMRARIAQMLALHGCLAEAEVMTGELVEHDDLLTYEIVPLAKASALFSGEPGAERMVRAVARPHNSSADRIAVAEHLAAVGHLGSAQRIWCQVLLRRIAPLPWITFAAQRLVLTGGAEQALALLAGQGDPVVAARTDLIHAVIKVAEGGA
ncbi:hypothetical protein [Actinoplanes sp. NPDC051851]|uniref:hypothetical protein n=1 Tax=Actinoplanes sp. NPDC051851 TaxID=3154753 RepID=UPI003449EC7F